MIGSCEQILNGPGIGALYNPFGVSRSEESGYLDDCTSRRQQRCAMGDLSRKLANLRMDTMSKNPYIMYSFYDENLFLAGKYTSELYSC